MKRKIFNVLFALVLLAGLSLIPALPAVADVTDVSITSPTGADPAFVQPGGTVKVTFDVTTDTDDYDTGEIHIQVRQGTNIIGSLGPFSYDFITNDTETLNYDIEISGTAAVGGYDVVVKAREPAGSGTWVTATEEDAVFVDTEAPTVEITSTATSPTNVNPIPMTATFSEDVVNFDDTDITVGNGEVTDFWGSGSEYDFEVTPDDDGEVTVDIAAGVATDLAGNDNEAAEQFSITYDGTKPVFEEDTTAETDYYKNGDTITLMVTLDAEGYTVTADFLEIDSEYNTGDEVVVDNADGTYTITYEISEGNTTGDGDYAITVTAKDEAGNEATDDSCSVTLDNTLPEITIAVVTTPTTENTQAISGTYDEVNLDEIVLTVNDVEVEITFAAGDWETTDDATLTEGANDIVATITDLAGNEATAEDEIVLDTIAPEVTDAAADPPIIQPETATDVTFSATITDEGSGIDDVTIDLSSLPGGAANQAMADVGDGVYEYVWADLEVTDVDDYVLTITATDEVDNVNDTVAITLSVIADTTAPVITDPVREYPFGLDSARPGDDVTISTNVIDNIAMGTVTADCDAFAASIDLLDDGVAPDETADDDIYTGTATIAGDAAKGDYTITITAEDAAGNPATDESLSASVDPAVTGYEFALVEGWNLISLPLIPGDADITIIISADNLASKNVSSVGIIRAYDPENGEFPYYMPETGDGELTEMNDGYGFWVFMNEDDTLTVTGRQWPAPPEVPPTYNVVVGWNLIGFKSLEDMIDFDEPSDSGYLLNIAGTYPVLWSYDAAAGAYSNVKGVDNGMEVGHGFWLWVIEAGTIVPPG